ncbi:HdeD family acid-resistance protein [Rubritalea spongiae]|uniref:HdeD family acid-resistance protein n=1 Tax=Rubritalea spongiae TaxID=430797 RepID=A0ABW5E0D1_9BACT
MDSPAISQSPILDLISKAWWLLFLRGLAAVIFALLAFTLPGMTIAVLIIYWAVYILLDGIFSLIASFKGGASAPRWWLILSGVISIIAGAVCISAPSFVAQFFIILLGWLCIFKGVVEVVGGLSAKSVLFLIGGILSTLFGIWCLKDPASVAKIIIQLVAAFSLIAGIVFILLSLKLRSRSKGLPQTIDV